MIPAVRVSIAVRSSRCRISASEPPHNRNGHSVRSRLALMISVHSWSQIEIRIGVRCRSCFLPVAVEVLEQEHRGGLGVFVLHVGRLGHTAVERFTVIYSEKTIAIWLQAADRSRPTGTSAATFDRSSGSRFRRTGRVSPPAIRQPVLSAR